jgi:hypothetical protein
MKTLVSVLATALLASCIPTADAAPAPQPVVPVKRRVPRQPPPPSRPPPPAPPAGNTTGYEKAQTRPAIVQPPIGRDASGNINVPNVFQMTQAEAEATLKRYGFERVSLEKRMCGSVTEGKIVEKGTICGQAPQPGGKASPRIPVYIQVQEESPYGGVLSGERKWFLMPDMVGWDLEKAKARIKQLGFVSKDVMISLSKDCAPNTICKTYPDLLTRTDNTSDKLFYVGQPQP